MSRHVASFRRGNDWSLETKRVTTRESIDASRQNRRGDWLDPYWLLHGLSQKIYIPGSWYLGSPFFAPLEALNGLDVRPGFSALTDAYLPKLK